MVINATRYIFGNTKKNNTQGIKWKKNWKKVREKGEQFYHLHSCICISFLAPKLAGTNQMKFFYFPLSSFKRFSSFLCSTLSSTSLSNRRHKSSHRRCSIEKTFHKKFATFTGKHLCWSHFLIICRSEDLQLY